MAPSSDKGKDLILFAERKGAPITLTMPTEVLEEPSFTRKEKGSPTKNGVTSLTSVTWIRTRAVLLIPSLSSAFIT